MLESERELIHLALQYYRGISDSQAIHHQIDEVLLVSDPFAYPIVNDALLQYKQKLQRLIDQAYQFEDQDPVDVRTWYEDVYEINQILGVNDNETN